MWRQIIFSLVLILALAACARPTSNPVSKSTLPLQILDSHAQNVTWSRDHIVYAKRASDQFLDVWTSKSDGTDKHCLTCSGNFARRNRTGIAPRPQNDFLVFVAVNPDARESLMPGLAHPSVLANTNLWAMKFDGGQTWKLTDLPTDSRAPRAVAQPRFSRDGKRLAWTEMLKRDSSPQFMWGEWAIVVADFVVEDNAPRVKNIRRVQVGDQHAFVMIDDWSPEGRALLLSGNLGRGQIVTGSDVFEYTLASDELVPLTNSREIWDAHARYSFDGKNIFWTSSADLRVTLDARDWQTDLHSELWMMERDGSHQQRLTFFNQPGMGDDGWFQTQVAKANRVITADLAPSPDGKKIALTLAYPNSTGVLDMTLITLDVPRENLFGTPATMVPREYQTHYAELDQSLTEFAARLDAQPKRESKPITFAADLSIADSARGDDLLSEHTYQNALAYLDALQTLGARGVQVAIRYPAFAFASPRAREYVAFYKRLAQEIRRRKMTLLVSASPSRANYRPASLEQYKQEKREHVATIVRDIQPDYLTIASEPSVEAKNTGLPITPTNFSEHVNFILGVVDHRNVRMGVGANNGDDLAYVQALAKNSSVDYYDIRIQTINPGAMTRAQEFIGIAQANKRPVLVGSAWLAKNNSSERFAFWQPLDAKFLSLTAQFARQNQIELVTFAPANYFFAYLDHDKISGFAPQNLAQLADLAALEQIRANQFNATGLAFQKLVIQK